jgi:cobalt-zinc-cadmium efflux system protein
METSVHHHHHHAAPLEGLNRAFVIGISLNALFVIIEVAAGFYSNSLALLTDAGP